MTEARCLRATEAWRLSGSVALRPESFGALAYDFATRRLTFLKTPLLVRVVRALGEHESVHDALVAEDVPVTQRPSYLAALSSLADGGLLERRTSAGPSVTATHEEVPA